MALDVDQVRCDEHGQPQHVWIGWRSYAVTVLAHYRLPARRRVDPVYGEVTVTRERECWHVRVEDGREGELRYDGLRWELRWVRERRDDAG